MGGQILDSKTKRHETRSPQQSRVFDAWCPVLPSDDAPGPPATDRPTFIYRRRAGPGRQTDKHTYTQALRRRRGSEDQRALFCGTGAAGVVWIDGMCAVGLAKGLLVHWRYRAGEGNGYDRDERPAFWLVVRPWTNGRMVVWVGEWVDGSASGNIYSPLVLLLVLLLGPF